MSENEKDQKEETESTEAGLSRLVINDDVLKLWSDPKVKKLLQDKKVRYDAWLMIQVLHDSKKAGQPISFSSFGKLSKKEHSKVLVNDRAIELFEKCKNDVELAYCLLVGYIQGSLERYDLMQQQGGIYANIQDLGVFDKKK